MPGHALIDLKQRLSNTRWPDAPQANDLKNLVAYWQTEYRWHNAQAAMNKYTHYRVPIADTSIHFLYHKGVGPKPMPLILTHGWPGSFWDLHQVIGPLTDPVAFGGKAEDAFDVVIPSLPGLVFSSPTSTSVPLDNFTADLWHTLMTDILGYTRYAATGVSWGAWITENLVQRYPKSPITTHVIQGASTARATQPAGHRLHTPDLQTWAYSLNDSPVALLAWLADRLPPGTPAGEHLITNTMLYWLTGTAASAAGYYKAGHEPGDCAGYMDRADAIVHDIRTTCARNR
jgi:pimeloyl-ACP methyl ester carboxylesterase